MASGDWIESVYTLGSLPAPLDAARGRIQAAPVTSLSKSKKRKRSEVCAAIDGEGINVYNVDDSNLLASYAVAPDTYFDAVPCPVYSKWDKTSPAQRGTYATTRPSPSSTTVRINHYRDGAQNAGRNAFKANTQILPSSAPTTLIDILPLRRILDTDTSHQVLTLQKDGTLSVYSESLDEVVWSAALASLPAAADDGFDLPEGASVVQAEILSLESAAKGILKSRPDLVSGVGPAEASSTYILVALVTSLSLGSEELLDLDVHIYLLRAQTTVQAAGTPTPPRQIWSRTLPRPLKRTASSSAQYMLNSATGSITELTDGQIATYELNQLNPRVADRLTPRDAIDSVVRLSSSLLLTASPSKFALYDSKYGSVLASQIVELSDSTNSKKRKAIEVGGKQAPASFIGHFAKSGVALALKANEIIALQLGESARRTKKHKTGTLLVDSIGKGLLNANARSEANFTQEQDAWKKQKWKETRFQKSESDLFFAPELDALLDSGDISDFERRFARAVDVKLARDTAKKAGNDEAQDDLEVAEGAEWQFPVLGKLHRLPAHRPQALYALSRIFGINTNKDGEGQTQDNAVRSSVQLKIYPENVFLWLIHTGQLRADLIERSLVEYEHAECRVPHGDMIKALANFDNSLALVHYVLTYHPQVHAEELVAAVKIIVNSLDNSILPQPEHKLLLDEEFANAAATTGALTNGVNSLLNGKSAIAADAMDKEADDQSEQAQDPTDAAMEDIDEMMENAYERLDSLPIRGESLRQALTKLHALPATTVTSVLRSRLTHHELIFLIHILRVELEQGGWTLRYGENPASDAAEMEEPSNRAIAVISGMLSCAVDAVGMSGWLMASAKNPYDSVDETLGLLRGEISNTLEGVHEATFIYGVLADFLRHHAKRQSSTLSLPQSGKVTGGIPQVTSGMDGVKGTEAERLRWNQGKTVIVEQKRDPWLPVGLGVEELGIKTSVELTERTLWGGIRKKTMRDIGREIRRELPPYVFERIRF